jgi:hypothetical protein
MSHSEVYIDTNIISRIADLRLKDSTAAAYGRLTKHPELEFVTSEKAREEIIQAGDTKRRGLLQFVLAFVRKVERQVVEWHTPYGHGRYGEGFYGGRHEDDLYTERCTVFAPAVRRNSLHLCNSTDGTPRISAFWLGFLIVLSAPGPVQAQGADLRTSCQEPGIVFSGLPTDRVFVVPDSVEVEPIDPAEAAEMQVVVSCDDGTLVYSSRGGGVVTYHPSGCFGVLDAGAAGQIHLETSSAPPCGDPEVGARYAEVLRTGVSQIIYRGTVSVWRPPIAAASRR